MNLPNKLTVLRICIVPFFIAAFYLPEVGSENISYNALAALMFFTAAALTDALDGHIARSQHLITNFGKFLDPLADKILTTTALIIFVELGTFSAIPVVIIIAREFMVSGLRLVTAGEGVVVPAGFSGKLKTAVTMVMIVLVMVTMAFGLKNWNVILQILMWISVALTVISGYDYFKILSPYINTNDEISDDEDFEVFDPDKDYSISNNSEKNDLKTEIKSEKNDLKTEIKSEKNDLKTEIKSEKSDLKTEIKSEKSDLKTVGKPILKNLTDDSETGDKR
jgi:CDP-diacylglycerol--glycerol-3-phosphate 3-phosphatidyltransferase